MFKTILKYTAITFLVLMLGQVPISNNTFGSFFLYGVGNGLRWSIRETLKLKWFVGMPLPDSVLTWLEFKPDKKVEAKLNEIPKLIIPDDKEADGVTPSDRAAIIQLLDET